jgi:hypothetical protein
MKYITSCKVLVKNKFHACMVFVVALSSLVSVAYADIVPQFPVNGLYACPSVIANVFSELLYVTDGGSDGPGNLPNGHKYCRYQGNAGGDSIFASYDRVTGHGVMFATVMHGTPGGSWITHDRNHADDEVVQMPSVASSKCNNESFDWFVNMGICQDRTFQGAFLKSEMDAMNYGTFDVYPGDFGLGFCTYGADWQAASCSHLNGATAGDPCVIDPVSCYGSP